jgi:8-oxo-dGTP pyrophosphatase MutT (NUDIX family)
MAEAMVFPGGMIDTSDNTGASIAAATRAGATGGAPPRRLVATVRASEDADIDDTAFRVGACRELFEEAGVCALDPAPQLTDQERMSWREKVRLGETSWSTLAAVSVTAQRRVDVLVSPLLR